MSTTARSIDVLRSFAATDGSVPEGNVDFALSYVVDHLIGALYGETEGGALSGTIHHLHSDRTHVACRINLAVERRRYADGRLDQ